jgi:hypothetical protein
VSDKGCVVAKINVRGKETREWSWVESVFWQPKHGERKVELEKERVSVKHLQSRPKTQTHDM